MILLATLMLSILLQFGAAVLALRFIPLTGRRTAWSIIAIAFLCMALRRCISIFHLITGDTTFRVDFNTELIGLGVSLLMVIGISMITPIFTERKRAEERLRESEERFTTIFNTQQNGIIVIDPETHMIVDANAAALHMIGATREDVIGHECHKFICPAERGKCPMTDLAIDVDNSERILIRANHTELSILKSATHMKLGGKNFLVESFIDITERKRSNEGLIEKENKLSSIFRAAPVGIGMVIDRVIQEANDTLYRMTGYSREELLGQNARMLYPTQEDYDFVGQEKYRQIDEKITGTVATHWKRKDGTIIDIILSSTPLDPDDHAKGVTFTALDITARKRTEDALRESKYLYDALAAHIPVGVYLLRTKPTGEFAFEYVSPQMAIMLGLSTESILADPQIAFQPIYPEESGGFIKLNREKIEARQPFLWEGRVVVKGTIKWLRIESQPELVDDGDVLWHGIVADITDRRKTEEEKRFLEERLRHTDKMDAIGTLAGGIAHDFNNLLMGIQGYASLALMDLDSSHPNYERLKRIEEHVQSGADLTKQLLGFARGGRYEVKPADMNDILEKSSALFGRTKKEISIRKNYGKYLRPVEVDRGQMEQVFMNLYVNAWQAMPGGGEIDLETEDVILDEEQTVPYAIKPGKYVKIKVTDTGTGMDEKTKERIFDPFFTTKGMGRGTGLGLATVYGIIKGHGGMIHVDSEPGQGTTFNIYLPASEKEVVQEKRATGTIARGTETILLVDDEKMVLEVSKEMLEFLGYRIYPVGSGQEAVAVYMEKRDKIDLVILDMVMPGISGGETFDRLREIDPDAKVLLSSGYSITGEAKTIMDRGCNGFIQKPFQLEKLSGKVREILG